MVHSMEKLDDPLLQELYSKKFTSTRQIVGGYCETYHCIVKVLTILLIEKCQLLSKNFSENSMEKIPKIRTVLITAMDKTVTKKLEITRAQSK